jgi:hypothetical protein
MHGRLNEEGVRPDQLIYALKDRKSVMDARRIDACLLCRNKRVNAAGLCEICYGALNGKELDQAVRWLSGQGP